MALLRNLFPITSNIPALRGYFLSHKKSPKIGGNVFRVQHVKIFLLNLAINRIRQIKIFFAYLIAFLIKITLILTIVSAWIQSSAPHHKCFCYTVQAREIAINLSQ